MPESRRWQPVLLPDLPPPAGPYSPAVRAGDFVYVSGQVPRDPATREVVGRDVTEQSRAVLDNLRRVLAAAGARMEDVVSTIVYLADENDWGVFNEVYRTAFQAPYPSRTAVGVQLRDVLVEVSAVAYVPAKR